MEKQHETISTVKKTSGKILPWNRSVLYVKAVLDHDWIGWECSDLRHRLCRFKNYLHVAEHHLRATRCQQESVGLFLQLKHFWSVTTPVTHDPGAKHIWRAAGCHDIKTLLQAYTQEIDHRITTQMLEVTQSRLEARVYSTTIYYSISSWHGIKLSAGCGAFNLCSLFSDSPTTVHVGMLTPAGRKNQ